MQICIPSVTHARLVALAVPLLLAAGIPSRAFATPIVIYDEAVDGDLSGRFGTTLSLNPGTNVINGTVTFTNNQSVPLDVDSFVFASADSVESMTLAIALLPVGSGVFDNVSLGLFDSSLMSPSIEDRVAIPSTGANLFSGFLPLPPGVGGFAFTQLGGGVDPGEFRTAAYSVSITVVPVPEPGTMTLIGLGLVLLRLQRLRQKSG